MIARSKGSGRTLSRSPPLASCPAVASCHICIPRILPKSFGDLMKQLMAKGWDRSTLDIASVYVPTANTALASDRTTRYRIDGSVMLVLGEHYCKPNRGGWRIEGLILHQPNKVVMILAPSNRQEGTHE